jgi:hypothetical protein
MRRKYLLGVVAVLVLLLAVWVVPMALAAAGSGAQAAPEQSRSHAPSGSQCPFLQAHPWMDPHGSGDTGGSSASSLEIDYY